MIELKKKRISNSFSLIYKAAKKQNKTKAKKNRRNVNLRFYWCLTYMIIRADKLRKNYR